MSAPSQVNTESHFKDLYFHLYSNSSSSRSERILADLSKLILVSIAYCSGEMKSEVSLFLNGNGTANVVLLPKLIQIYPDSLNTSDNFSLDDEALRHSLNLLNKIDFPSSPSHTFGDAFQALMGPRLRGDKGQFFTPRSVVRALVKMLCPEEGTKVIDPACGTGGFLSAVLDNWEANNSFGEVFGIDKDRDLALLASALSNVHGKNSRISIHATNSLSLGNLEKLNVELESFDYVITNPPFGAKIGITDKDILAQYSLGRVWNKGKARNSEWLETDLVRATQDPQILFTELCVRLLRPGGKMAIVLPEGIFGNSSSGYVWSYLRKCGNVISLLDCPRTTFQPGTDTKTNILIFEKLRDAPRPQNKAWIAVAYSCGHDKRGRSFRANGTPVQDDFHDIAEDWSKKPSSRKHWNHVEIQNPFYLVPRYYDQVLSSDVECDAKKLGTNLVSLGKLVKSGLITVKKGHEVGSEAYGSGEIPFIRTSDIHNFETASQPTNSVSEEVYEKYRETQNLKSGDILMVVDGRYKIGRCAILHDWTTRCIVQSHVKIISQTDIGLFDPVRLLYGLSLPSVQKEIRRLVFIQSTLGGLGSRINEIRIPDPTVGDDWGKEFIDFCEAIKMRAQYAATLHGMGKEVEL